MKTIGEMTRIEKALFYVGLLCALAFFLEEILVQLELFTIPRPIAFFMIGVYLLSMFVLQKKKGYKIAYGICTVVFFAFGIAYLFL